MVNAIAGGTIVVNENEASVEEILESIKRVIDRDNRDAATNLRNLKAAKAEGPDEPSTSGSEDEVLDLADMELSEFVEMDDSGEAPLVADDVRGAMQENLAALAMLAEPGAKPQIVRSGETSLEGLTRELLRPMLAEWLEQNLPGMVEKMVQAEIARIAGKRN